MPDSPSADPIVPSDTLVFVPGMNHRREDVQVDGLAARIAHALDQRAATRSARFRVVAPRDDRLGAADARWIERLDGEQVTACVAIHVLPVLRPFIERFEAASQPRQLLRVLTAMAANFGRWLVSFFRNGRAAFGRLSHLLYLGSWLALFVAYVASLFVGTAAVLVAAIDAIGKLLADAMNEPGAAGATAALLHGWGVDAAALLGGAVALGRVARMVVPAGLVDRVGMNARAATVVCEVMDGRRDRGEALGMVPGLLEQLFERDGARGRIHLIGYSFGSIALLDTFAVPEEARGRALREVATLTTIGLPFDLVALLWPTHIESWSKGGARPATWFNVTHDGDPFGSAGMKQWGKERSDALGLLPTETFDGTRWGQIGVGGAWSAFTFASSRLHERYWDRDTADAVTCFDLLVERWFAGGKLLA